MKEDSQVKNMLEFPYFLFLVSKSLLEAKNKKYGNSKII